MLSSSSSNASTDSNSSSSSTGGDIPSHSGRNEAGRPDPAYRTAADGGFFSYQRANLPKQCAAFLKELLGVADRTRRVALINKVRPTAYRKWMCLQRSLCHSTARYLHLGM